MGSELFALKEVFLAVQRRCPQHNLRLSSYGACEKLPACLEFLHKNHGPTHLVGDMLAREVHDGGNKASAWSACKGLLMLSASVCGPAACHASKAQYQLPDPCSKVQTRTIDGGHVTIPKDALGMYVLGFPCTPWSLRGEGARFDDPNCKPFWAGLSTIKLCCPKTFVMENARASGH